MLFITCVYAYTKHVAISKYSIKGQTDYHSISCMGLITISLSILTKNGHNGVKMVIDYEGLTVTGGGGEN